MRPPKSSVMVTVLADSAEESREIDIDRAKKARERAEERLKMAKSEDTDFARAQAAPFPAPDSLGRHLFAEGDHGR